MTTLWKKRGQTGKGGSRGKGAKEKRERNIPAMSLEAK